MKTPPIRNEHAMAYDAAHARVVLFGGYNGSALSDTWTWDGKNWTPYTLSSPSARYNHMMAYDAANTEVVLFGGYDGSTGFNDTWMWNGSDWTQYWPSSSPTPRDASAMAYDAAISQIVLFDGIFSSDTWEGGACIAPSITTQPATKTVTSGSTATLTVAASGTTPFIYQWYQGLPGHISVAVGSNANTFTTPPMFIPTSYWVSVSNSCGHADSNAAIINVTAGCVSPSIQAQPQGQTVTSGETATLSVTADGTAPLHYQWYQGTYPDISSPFGSDSNTCVTSALTTTTGFWVRVSGACDSPADSNTATVTVNTTTGGPTIT